MLAVTVSPKFWAVNPLAVRQALGFVPGVKLNEAYFDNRVELISLRCDSSSCKFARGDELFHFDCTRMRALARPPCSSTPA